CYAVLKTNHNINTLADLNDPSVRVALDVGSGAITRFPAKYPKATVVQIVPPAGALNDFPDILAGRADVAPFDHPLVYAYRKLYKQFKFIPKPDRCFHHPDLPTPVGVGVAKDADPAFVATVQRVVNRDRAKLAKSLRKYSLHLTEMQYFGG